MRAVILMRISCQTMVVPVRGGSFGFGKGQNLLVGIDNKHRKQAGGLDIARVGADAVMVSRHLVEVLAGMIHLLGSIVHLAADRSLEDGGVDESRFWVRVCCRGAAGPVFDQHTLHAYA